MSTILWNEIVFGPIHSRRLGSSLGINLMPTKGKVCSFDCIYCECGWNKDGKKDSKLPSKEEVFEALTKKAIELKNKEVLVDTITFSGNGEPTIHPDFPAIIDFTLKIREEYFPNAVVSVLSNASQIGKKEISDALKKIDNPILKIDSGLEEYIHLIDRPQSSYSLEKTINNLVKFEGNFILQTMFLKGKIEGKEIDCTSPLMVDSWIALVLKLRPREVMMYTIDRETPSTNLEKVTEEQMKIIAEPLIKEGIKVQIRG